MKDFNNLLTLEDIIKKYKEREYKCYCFLLYGKEI